MSYWIDNIFKYTIECEEFNDDKNAKEFDNTLDYRRSRLQRSIEQLINEAEVERAKAEMLEMKEIYLNTESQSNSWGDIDFIEYVRKFINENKKTETEEDKYLNRIGAI